MLNKRVVKSKGQIALETIIVVGFVMALMSPLLYMLYTRITEIQQEMLLLEATRAVDTIANTVSTVGAIGPNGTATVDVSFPTNIKSLTIGGPNNREVTIVVYTTLGEIDIPRLLYFNVTESGTIPRTPGSHKIVVVYPETGGMRVSPA